MPHSTKPQWDYQTVSAGMELSEYIRYHNRRLPQLTPVVNAPLQGNRHDVTAAYEVLRDDFLVLADATGGAFTVTLPAANTMPRQIKVIKRMNSGANAIVVDSTSTFDGATSLSLDDQYATVMLISDASNWLILSTRGTVT